MPTACPQVVGAAGLPLSVQVAAAPYDDETALRVMRLLEEQLRGGTAAAPAAAAPGRAT